MIMENLGEILMAAGFLFVVAAICISMKKASADEGDGPDISEWT